MEEGKDEEEDADKDDDETVSTKAMADARTKATAAHLTTSFHTTFGTNSLSQIKETRSHGGAFGRYIMGLEKADVSAWLQVYVPSSALYSVFEAFSQMAHLQKEARLTKRKLKKTRTALSQVRLARLAVPDPAKRYADAIFTPEKLLAIITNAISLQVAQEEEETEL